MNNLSELFTLCFFLNPIIFRPFFIISQLFSSTRDSIMCISPLCKKLYYNLSTYFSCCFPSRLQLSFSICKVSTTIITTLLIININNKMLNFMIHAEYEGGDLAEKIPVFCNYRYLHNPHESSKRTFYFLYLHHSLTN